MKIKSVSTISLAPIEGMRVVVCRIDTDNGVHGLGEIGVAIGTGAYAAREMIEEFGRMILGMDPLETDVIWDMLYRTSFWGVGNGAVIMSAISAIDTALWDIKGKFFDVPVYVLLGGKQQPKLRAYASQLQMGWDVEHFTSNETPESLALAAKKAVDQGYTAIKANFIGLDRQGNRRHPRETLCYLDRDDLNRAEERLAAVRNAVGKDIDIICENHCITDVNTAIRYAKMYEKYDILFLEEPAVPLSASNYRRIADNTSIPLATGERTYQCQGFLPLVTEGRLSVAQPDIGSCGGPTEFKRIADMCRLYDVSLQAHTCSGPISVAVALHCECAISNFMIHEHHVMNTLPANYLMGQHNNQPKNGFFEIPDLPGFGQELSDLAMEHAVVHTIQ